tara:strand:- start:391 stop:651 length:261 start_codon:yes stop_codon:yes gene_type:complete
MKIKTFIGWDIGGSNTKISIIKSNKAKSEVHEIELWHDAGLSKLKKLISDLGTNQKRHIPRDNFIRRNVRYISFKEKWYKYYIIFF